MAAVKVYADTLSTRAALTVGSRQTLGWTHSEHKASAHPEPGERSALVKAALGPRAPEAGRCCRKQESVSRTEPSLP